MFPSGPRYYLGSNASIVRQIGTDEVLMSFSNPTNATVILVYELWFSPRGTDFLHENNAMEIVRTSSEGSGGSNMTQEALDLGNPVGAGMMLGINVDADGWSTPPPVTDVLGGARPFNLASGWRWTWADTGTPLIISPATSGIGFRMVWPPSVSLTFEVGAMIGLTGSA